MPSARSESTTTAGRRLPARGDGATPPEPAVATRRPCGYRLKLPIDVVVSGTLLLLLSPVMLAIALAVRWTSRGPVFYRHRRLGLGEKPFFMLKFRSMYVDADRKGPQFTMADDPRITRVGRFLRRTSLDELPQLFNVLAGDMSLIGPRPYVGFELEGCQPADRAERAAVRPGVTGLAQASGRSSLSQEESMNLDLQYVRRCGLALDLSLFPRTLVGVMSGRGTN